MNTNILYQNFTGAIITTTTTTEPATTDTIFTMTTTIAPTTERITTTTTALTTSPTTNTISTMTTTIRSATTDIITTTTTAAELTTKDSVSTTIITSEPTMTDAISTTLTNAISTTTPETTTTTQTTKTQGGNVCFDCNCALNTSSVTMGMFLLGNNKTVLCVMDTVNSHKWTIIQRRSSPGGQSFDKNWSDYENGFGSLNTEFWIGNKYLHELTSLYGNTHLRIDMTTAQGKSGFVEYTFYIDDASQNYTLHTSNYVGMMGDPFISTGSCTECADGMKFTTRDRDNDLDNAHNCALLSGGGWWHNACQRSNLNGQFGQSDYLHGINWNGFVSLSVVEMKVRRP
ncbi:ficolin-1-like [Saccostrea echinata]|uniref:ficolin-1-like n=1 Tax=Saccostrea echinata TaxID=191078 RepID=UPI002A7F4338|nr:ficolin-1-like [Saccostrea echinata]